jgi:hypothetical protein
MCRESGQIHLWFNQVLLVIETWTWQNHFDQPIMFSEKSANQEDTNLQREEYKINNYLALKFYEGVLSVDLGGKRGK